MQGGLPPKISNMERARRLERPTYFFGIDIISDVLWVGPDKNIPGWAETTAVALSHWDPKAVTSFLQ